MVSKSTERDVTQTNPCIIQPLRSVKNTPELHVQLGKLTSNPSPIDIPDREDPQHDQTDKINQTKQHVMI